MRDTAVGEAPGEAAAAWRSRFVSLFDRAPVALAISDAYGLILGANPAFASAWQLQPGKLEGRLLLDILTPTNDRQLRRLDEALRSRRRSRYPVEVSWQVRERPATAGSPSNRSPTRRTTSPACWSP